MTFASLSENCLATIMHGTDFVKPILQVLGTRRLPVTGGSNRYRLLVSDGKNVISYAMLATQLNSYGDANKLDEYTIIRIENYMVSVVSHEKKVMVILDLTVLHPGTEVKAKIGDPKYLSVANLQEETVSSNNHISINVGSNAVSIGSNAVSVGSNAVSVGSNAVSVGSNAVCVGSNHPSTSRNTTPIGSANAATCTISSLSPYQSNWVIRARVTSKTNVRTWKNTRGEGKLFNMDLMDEGGEIRATCFNDEVDKYYDIIQTNKVYYISKCGLKSANKQYNTCKNDYEMTLTCGTIVEECLVASDTVPNVTYNFVPLSEIKKMDANAIVDVAGICRDVGDISQVTIKATGRELAKRLITLVDNSLTSVTLTLWGQDAEAFHVASGSHPVIIIKGGKINEFGGGKSVTVSFGSSMKINPDISETLALREWYENEGIFIENYSKISTTFSGSSSTDWMNFYECKNRNLGSTEKPDYFQCKAIIYVMKTSSCVYKSCPKSDCHKKVIDQENGTYKCDKCQKCGPDFKYRLLLNANIADWTTNRWVTIFSDHGETVLGSSSDEVGRAFYGSKNELETIFSKVLYKSYIFKFRTKMEVYADASRNKINVMSISPVNHKKYNNYLVNNIQAMTGIGINENQKP